MSSPTTGSAQSQPSATPARAEQHGQRGEAVGAGVQPVGDQRRRADLAAGPDAVPGDQLVAREPDQRRGGDRDQVRDAAAGASGGHRLVGGQRRGRGDGQHDHDPGQVLGPAVAVGVAAGRRAAADENATPSGTAVSASAALCRVSPSSATDPDNATTAAWISAVTPSTPGRSTAPACPPRWLPWPRRPGRRPHGNAGAADAATGPPAPTQVDHDHGHARGPGLIASAGGERVATPSMTGKPRCSTSTTAAPAHLQPRRACGDRRESTALAQSPAKRRQLLSGPLRPGG